MQHPDRSPLLTDLYQIAMVQAYLDAGMTDEAVFELFVRRLPPNRGYLVAAGVEAAVAWLEELHFTEEELAYVSSLGRFRENLITYLRELRFTGDIWAVPEGTMVIADEPILRVRAPLPLAQLVETKLLNLVHFGTVAATKAARCRQAAGDRLLVDFGLRRAHGAEAGMLASWAAYVAGFDATSNVAAGARWGIPVSGTVAHSFIEAHDDELTAFLDFARAQPEHVVLLLDTYDTLAAARKAVEVAQLLAESGIQLLAVRLDSGEILELAHGVREILDAGGCTQVKIFVSGDMDEYRIAELLAAGAPIDGFGPGTRLVTSADAPYLNAAYKLMRYAGRPRMKLSPGKATWPDVKCIYRFYREDGRWDHDLLALAEEHRASGGVPLLEPFLEKGRRVRAPEDLETIRRRVAKGLAALPPEATRLTNPTPPQLHVSPQLEALREALERQLRNEAD